ncbi:MAG: PAS domain S-box protein [Chloroflexaceae bacterium]|nr:PAS domain S-box protein [Chloroflexaceae bacterium]
MDTDDTDDMDDMDDMDDDDMDRQSVATLQQENQRLREQVAALEEERNEARARYQLMEDMLEQSNVPTCLWIGEEMIYHFANHAYRVGTGKHHPIGKPLREVFEEREIPGLTPVLEQVYASGKPQVVNEALVRLPNVETGAEEERWYNLVYNPVCDEHGKMVGVSNFAVEVTAQVRARQELHRQAQILEQVRGSVVVTDLEGTVISCNRDTTRIFGYQAEELREKPILTFYPPEEQERLRKEVLAFLQTQTELEIEITTWNKAGKRFPIRLSLSLLRNDSGTPIGMIGYAVDISERKQREQELQIFKTLVDAAPDGIGIAALDTGQVIYANPAYRTMFGYGDEVIGTHWEVLSAESSERLAQLAQDIIEQSSWHGELNCRRKDGSIFPVSSSSIVLRSPDGQIFGLAGIARDLTEQKQAEAERLTLQQQIIEAQRDTLRELSTPLIPIADDVVIMPLIGAIDSRRAQQMLETLLEGVAHYQAALVILDITGVRVVDTQVAQTFIQAAQAVRLLGAQVMLTGIQPQIAQTLVHLGIDLRDIITRGSLQAGIATALNSNGR